MKLSKERVAALSASLVDKLTAGGMIEPVGERKALVASLERVVTDELSVEDRINAQAKELMSKYEAEIARGHLDEHQVFLMIKKQLVKEKGVIL
jgi:hypothetical protein